MGKTSLLKTTMKNFFLFLPLFFVTLVSAMDMKQNNKLLQQASPHSLQYLAALKIPAAQYSLIDTKCGEECATKAKAWIQSELTRKKKIEEANTAHYNNELIQICKKENNSFTLEQLYAIRPQLIDTQKKELFDLCLEHGNSINGEWLLTTFPELADNNLLANLKQCVTKQCAELFKLLLKTNPKIVFQKNKNGKTYLSEILEHGHWLRRATLVSRWLLFDKNKNSRQALAWGIAHRDAAIVKSHISRALSEQHKQSTDSNDTHLVIELFKDLVLSVDSDTPESLAIIELLLVNQDFKQLCTQEITNLIFVDKFGADITSSKAYRLLLQHSQPLETTIIDHLTDLLTFKLGRSSYFDEQGYETIKSLIDYGAKPLQIYIDPFLSPDGGHHEEPAMQLALQTAAKEKNENSHGKQVIDLLLSKFPQEEWPTNPIHFNGAAHFITLFVAHKFDINARNKNGWTPLFSLITGYYGNYGERLKKVAEFLELGADPNITNAQSNSAYYPVRTPLAEVLERHPKRNSDEMINLLKFYGAVEKLPTKPQRWQIHQGKSYKNATFQTTLNRKMQTSLNVGNPFSYFAAAQAFRDKKGTMHSFSSFKG